MADKMKINIETMPEMLRNEATNYLFVLPTTHFYDKIL